MQTAKCLTPKELLLIKINTLRDHMICVGMAKGLTDTETVEISQRLDVLLNEYRSMKK